MDEALTAFQRITGEQFGNIGLLFRINFVNAQKKRAENTGFSPFSVRFVSKYEISLFIG
ncbi:hypothetical protein [Paenibacillus sp. HGF5]|uniref:hypothetical protein n=1 Tax=Paenibacillus sp. HGF5 TaxID=908341 RepID=UPI000207227D|nr:hypothetical protein [Paenibacillus sp. HGF5]EGG37861.1 hypothetical protein HMPREF9412_4877 [Paenibacillus sp. HGF5]